MKNITKQFHNTNPHIKPNRVSGFNIMVIVV